MDTTLQKQPAASDRMAKTAGYYSAFLAFGLAGAVVGPTIGGLAANTHSSLSAITYFMTASALGYLLGSIQGGRLYDRVAGHKLLATMLLMLGAMLALVPLIRSLWLLLLVAAVLGVTEGVTDVGGNALLVWVHGRGVGPFMNGLHFFYGLGAFISPLIVAQAIGLSGGITWAYWVMALLVLPPALWLLHVPSPANSAADSESGEPVAPANNRLVALVAALLFLFVGAEMCFGNWAYTYAVRSGMGSATIAAYFTAAFWGALTAGRLLGVPLSARLLPQQMLLGDILGCLFGIGLILAWPQSELIFAVGAVIFGLSIASAFATCVNLGARYMAITGRIQGWFCVGASLGSMALPWIVGQLFEVVGPSITLWGILVDVALALGVLAAATRAAQARK